MAVQLLSEYSLEFPHPALADERGILAVGGDLAPERLLEAYRHGIFPWYSEVSPILWWSPDPRCVLYPDELKVSKSMRPYFNQQKYDWSLDCDFESVIRACATIRRGTWIHEEMIEAYCELHELGYAHSVEVWEEGELVGGLYGIAIGKCFFGESMFTRRSNASKFGFIQLVRYLQARDYRLIDCQQETRHLKSLGAKPIPRASFLRILEENEGEATDVGIWKK